MSVRRRVWGPSKDKESWVCNFTDASGKRRLKTFRTKQEADRFNSVAKAVGSGLIPEPLTRGCRAVEFSLPVRMGWKKNGGREAIAAALREAHPRLQPTTESVIVHVTVETPPSHVVADVDNLLKPVLDALKGVAWMDDTQVCELLCRRIPARASCLRVKIWQVPGPVLASHLNALAQAGHPATAKRP
jgi:Holliday junction resolvase RusA-like endonuclease